MIVAPQRRHAVGTRRRRRGDERDGDDGKRGNGVTYEFFHHFLPAE
jgi:hypothetical protein